MLSAGYLNDFNGCQLSVISCQLQTVFLRGYFCGFPDVKQKPLNESQRSITDNQLKSELFRGDLFTENFNHQLDSVINVKARVDG